MRLNSIRHERHSMNRSIPTAISALFLLLFTLPSAAQSPPSKPLISIAVQSQTPAGGSMALMPPAIAQEGFTAMLTADVQGSGPLAFQWFLNGANIDGATNAVHMLQTLERTDEGTYSVVVTNTAGRSISDPARLLVSNVKSASFMSLLVTAPTSGVMQIQYANSLASNALWQPLAGVTTSVAPLVIVDPGATNVSQRFYKTPVAQSLKGRLLPGWIYPDATGSVHAIEFIEPQSGSTTWRTLQTITLSPSPYLFVDATATNGLARRYRTTMLESPAGRRVGRLVSAVTWFLPPNTYTNVTQTNRQALAGLGISLNDQDHTLQFPSNALPGYWVVLGDQRVMTDSNGNFQIDLPFGITNGFVVPQRGNRSTIAEATFAVNQLVLPGQVPTPIVVRFEHEGALNMDALPATTLAGRPKDLFCGNPGVHVGNTIPCCLDYNGYIPTDCKDTSGGLDSSRVLHYLGSTCFGLVNAGWCAREYNSHAIGFRVPRLTCYRNHKYRNCQNVDRTGLWISASAAMVKCGESIDLTIHNNTWANETELLLSPSSMKNPGTLIGDRVFSASSPSAFTLRHYDDVPPMHFEDQVIHYTAPTVAELQSAGGDQRIQVTARGGGVERTLEITVTCCSSDMALIPGGAFAMGSDEYPGDGEQPVHTVQVGAFCMDKYEVTKALWDEVYSWGVTHGYSFDNPGLGRAATHPVHTVSWYNIVKWCNARSEKEGRVPAYYTGAAQIDVYRSGAVNVRNDWVKWNAGYRLPTEAEWEKASRGGLSGRRFPWGDTISHAQANYYGYPAPNGYAYDLAPLGYHPTYATGGFPYTYTSPVGSFAANGYGLHDMAGNVWEWCWDWHGMYGGTPQTDPRGPATGSWRVLRGGGWNNNAIGCWSAYRYYSTPAGGTRFGFRVVLAPGQ